jgi:hypothetical protein
MTSVRVISFSTPKTKFSKSQRLLGIHNLFEHLISAIIVRKDIIEQENELKKRDSVFLSSVSTPDWSPQADEEEAREKARHSGAWSCC